MAQKLFLKSIKMILLIQTPISRLVGFCHHWTCSLLNVIVSDAGSILNLVLNLCYILLSDLRFVSQLLVYVETDVLAPCRQALQYFRKVKIFTFRFVIQLLYYKNTHTIYVLLYKITCVYRVLSLTKEHMYTSVYFYILSFILCNCSL